MGFTEAVRICLRKYVDFNGRARRSEYWWFVLFTVLVGIAAGILDAILWPGIRGADEGPLAALSSLALLLPSLAVFVRRLHDFDRTAWWALFFYGALIATAFSAGIGIAAGATAVTLVSVLLLLGICVWAIVWMAMPGTSGPNRFGPDPLDRDANQTLSPTATG
jgi:uncharacterized membrane protein YhaH (DUF805 family)